MERMATRYAIDAQVVQVVSSAVENVKLHIKQARELLLQWEVLQRREENKKSS